MIPALSPLVIPHAICYGCGSTMRPAKRQLANGKVTNLTLFCDTCKYGHEVSLQHVSGSAAPYELPPAAVDAFVDGFKAGQQHPNAPALRKPATAGPSTPVAPAGQPTSSAAMSEKSESKSGTLGTGASDLLVAGAK